MMIYKLTNLNKTRKTRSLLATGVFWTLYAADTDDIRAVAHTEYCVALIAAAVANV